MDKHKSDTVFSNKVTNIQLLTIQKSIKAAFNVFKMALHYNDTLILFLSAFFKKNSVFLLCTLHCFYLHVEH